MGWEGMMLGFRMARIAWLGVAALMVMTTGACDSDPLYPDDMAIYEVEVTGEVFRVALVDEAQIARADALLASGTENVLHGTVRRGNGGFNGSYSWHLEPATVTFPDLAMEVCDGRPQSDVQSDVDYWVDTIKYYCPWGAKIVRRVNA